jgi:TIR domain
MRRAFVSHSTSDDSFVAEMESFLRAAGFDEVFNDVSAIRPDERFWSAIEKGIADADTLVVVITAASNASEWVKREVEHARSLSKEIIPVWREDCPIPPIFADRRVIDFRPRTREERSFDISRIVKYAPAELVGRGDETRLLNDAWQKVLRVEKGRPHVVTFVARGGEGKTSLVAKWCADLAHQDWPGCDAAFAWSFYSQGTREQLAASSDLFLKAALSFFGDDADKQFAASPAGAFEKGQRLARAVSRRRSLLILDGLEPLQYAPTSPTPGELKDQGVAALLKGLAAASHGLCVVTTRYSLPDLKAFWQTTAPEVKLLRLSRDGGVHLLKTLGVRGSERRNIPLKDGDEKSEKVNEFEKLVEDVKGHALTLNLLGSYLSEFHTGDVRKRDLVNLKDADDEEQGEVALFGSWMPTCIRLKQEDATRRRTKRVNSRSNSFDCLALLTVPRRRIASARYGRNRRFLA